MANWPAVPAVEDC